MASDTAGKWIIGLLIYFVVVFILFSAIANISAESGTSFAGSTSGLTSLNQSVTLGAQCGDPRFYFDANGQKQEYFFTQSKLECSSTLAQNSQTCGQLQGCTYANVTSGFWWWETVTAQCIGSINGTWLADGNPNYQEFQTIFGDFGFEFNYSSLDSINPYRQGFQPIAVCDAPKLDTDQNLCELVGCTFTSITPEQASQLNSPSIFDVASFMFGGRIDLAGDISPTFYWIIILIFNYMPFIILSIAIAVYIRG